MRKMRARTRKKKSTEGKVYCSPGCGGGCTKAEHDGTKMAYEGLVKVLGRGWKVRLWENLGWFGEAVFEGDGMTVTMRWSGYKERELPFNAEVCFGTFLGVEHPPRPGGIKFSRQYSARHSDPKRALLRLVARIQEDEVALRKMAATVAFAAH